MCFLYRILLILSLFQQRTLVEAWIPTFCDRCDLDAHRAHSVLDTSLDASRRRPLRHPIRRSSSEVEQQNQADAAETQKRYEQALQDPTLLSNIAFDDPLLSLDPSTLRAVTRDMGLQRLTEIQAQTWPAAVTGQSLLGRARTGTGKTLAFLLPALQRLGKADLTVYRPGRTIGVLILAPTRELAIQIADQATALLTHHQQRPGAWTVQCVFGGTKINRDRAVLSQRIPTVLVATPGRLQDLLEQKTRVAGKRLFSDVIGDTKIVVLDEADRLLEAFPIETKKILSYLPRTEKRQTMLFSATFSKRLKGLLARGDGKVLPVDHKVVDCIGGVGPYMETNVRIEESYVQLSSMEHYLTGLVSIVREAVESNDSEYPKLLIFFPTAKIVKFAAELLTTCDIVQSSTTKVLHIHSRMSQAARNSASTQFRHAKRAILLTSDVSARGVDYPDVSLVVQYGAPYNKDLYLHRLGRTGRAGSPGNGLLVFLPFETAFKLSLQKRKVPENSSTIADVNVSDPEIEREVSCMKQRVQSGHPLLRLSAEAAYRSFIAHYLEYASKEASGSDILEAANALASAMGLVEVPSLPEDFVERRN